MPILICIFFLGLMAATAVIAGAVALVGGAEALSKCTHG